MGEEDRQLKYINVGMEFTSKVARKILDNLEGEEQAEQLDIMRTVMKECVRVMRACTMNSMGAEIAAKTG